MNTCRKTTARARMTLTAKDIGHVRAGGLSIGGGSGACYAPSDEAKGTVESMDLATGEITYGTSSPW